MMSKNHLTIFIIPFIILEIAAAKSIVDCRVVTGGTTECDPYSSKFIRAEEIRYDLDRKKLIVVKTLPIPKKKPSLKVISVADMIERYVKVEDSMRFKGTEETPPLKETKKAIDTQIEKIRSRRKELLEVMQKFRERKEKKRLEALKLAEEKKKKELEEKQKKQGVYVVRKGDTLSMIATKLNMKTKALRSLNHLKKKSALQIGQKLKVPYSQKRMDALINAEYKVESGDTLISIADKFDLSPKALAKFNHMKSNTFIRTGKVLLLPLPYKLAEIKKKKKAEAKKKKAAISKKRKMLKPFGKRKLRVTATAYSSHRAQTDKTPFLAAWNNRLRPGMKIIAVSRDMLTRYGMRNGTKVRIGGLPGIYRVRDKMNKRYKKRIDIYMGTNRRKALRWGRRSVVIYW